MNMPPKHPSTPSRNLLLHRLSSLVMFAYKFDNSNLTQGVMPEPWVQKQEKGCETEKQDNEAELVAQKHALKEEAKQTLLKECYKMAMNKYLRLIQMGFQGFSIRDWSVIHLNTAICFQFQDRLSEALQKVNEAIRIDPSYDKAYYRRLVILDEMGEQELVFHDNIVPSWIKNAELEKLKAEIGEKYRKTIGLAKLTAKLQDIQFRGKLGAPSNVKKFVDEAYRNIFSRQISITIDRVADGLGRKDEGWNRQISQQMASHYRFLKRKGSSEQIDKEEWMSSFWKNLYRIIIRSIVNPADAQAIPISMLLPFWEQYCGQYISQLEEEEMAEHFTIERQGTNEQNVGSSEKGLLMFCPIVAANSGLFIRLMKALLKLQFKKVSAKSTTKMLVSNIRAIKQIEASQLKLKSQNYEEIQVITDGFIEGLHRLHSNHQMGDEAPLLIDKFLELEALLLPRKIRSRNADKHQKLYVELYRLKYMIGLDAQGERCKAALELMHRVLLSASCFACMHLIYQVMNLMPAAYLREAKQREDQIAQLEELLMGILSQATCQESVASIGKNVEQLAKLLLLICVVGHLDPIFIIKRQQKSRSPESKNNSNPMMSLFCELCDLERVSSFLWAPNHASRKFYVAIYAQVLTLFAVSDLNLLSKILDYPSELTVLYGELFSSDTEEEHFAMLNSPIKLLYALVVDLKAETEKDYAQQLGVTQEEVSKTRQLQGQNRDPQLLNSVSEKREELILHMTTRSAKEKPNDWKVTIRRMIATISDKSGEMGSAVSQVQISMATSILVRLAQKGPSLLIETCFINFMLGCFRKCESKQVKSKLSKEAHLKVVYSVGRYFSLVCKNCNPNIISYPQLQPIVDSLVFVIAEAKHQLHMFESLLALINLSSRMENCLMEQNQYIVHGGLELLNNLLVNAESISNPSQRHWAKLVNLQHMCRKYYQFYREALEGEIKSGKVHHLVPISNYSHPYKIYGTLISLQQLFEAIADAENQETGDKKTRAQAVPELAQWKSAYRSLKHISQNKGDVGVVLFKLVLYHAEKGTLPPGWSQGLETVLGRLKQTDALKFGKIERYLK